MLIVGCYNSMVSLIYRLYLDALSIRYDGTLHETSSYECLLKIDAKLKMFANGSTYFPLPLKLEILTYFPNAVAPQV